MQYEHADLVVVGGGILGACVAWQAARQKLSVLLLDQARPGSSRTCLRPLRLAGPHPGRVELALQAARAWAELESDALETLVLRTGSLELGPREGPRLAACREALDLHLVPYENLEGAELRARFPQFAPRPDTAALHQPDGGLLAAGRALRAAWKAARSRGAQARVDTRVRFLDLDYERPTAVAGDTVFRGRAMVVAPGPWLGSLLPDAAPRLALRREHLGRFRPERPELFTPDRFPGFTLQEGDTLLSGLAGPAGDALTCWRPGGATDEEPGRVPPEGPDPREVDRLRALLRDWIPGAAAGTLPGETDLVAVAPDGELLLGPLPVRDDMVVAGGLAGSAFQLAPRVAELAVHLARGEGARFDLERYSLKRPALQDEG